MNNRVAIFIEKDNSLVVPHLTTEWKNTTRIVGTGEFISDFCMIQDAKGRWHIYNQFDGSDRIRMILFPLLM